MQLLHLATRSARAVQRRLTTLTVYRALRRQGLASAYRIPTFTAREELETLWDLARACPSEARVLEIGSYLGASTCFIAAGLRGRCSRIVCVDTWHSETMPEGERDTLPEFERNVSRIRERLTLVRKPSSEVLPGELEGPFDLVFLDGDHSYKQARTDFELVAPLLRPTGVLAFHDSLFFEGVSRVIGEALASGRWQLIQSVRNLCWLKPADFEHRS